MSDRFDNPDETYQGLHGDEARTLAHLQRALLASAIDYAYSASEEFIDAEQRPARLKYAVLHLWSSIELLLKCRILMDDWRKVVACPTRKVKHPETGLDREEYLPFPSFRKFAEGRSNTVYFDQLVGRLKLILSQEMEHDDDVLARLLKKHKPSLERFRELRNTVEHFTEMPTKGIFEKYEYGELWRALDVACKEKWEPVVARAWSFVFEAGSIIVYQVACNTPFGGDSREDDLTRIKKKVAESEDFTRHRYEEIAARLQAFEHQGALLLPCFYCGETTLPLAGGPKKCVFCETNHWEDVFFEDWWERNTNELLADGGTIPVGHPLNAGTCPSCNERGWFVMVDELIPEVPDVATICFYCYYFGRKKLSEG